MPTRSIILIALAVLLAGATALIARGLLSEPPAEQQVVQTKAEIATRVLVAAKPLAIGKLIIRDDFLWQSWPDEKVHPSYLMEGVFNADQLVGHVVRSHILSGEPVTRASLVAPGAQGFLAAALTPGMRAVTVPVNQVSGIAGFLFPGDRVDLILNHEVTGSDGEQRKASETVIKNLRILAVDTRTGISNGPDGAGPQPQLGKTVTLEVTPKLAEKISLVEQIGSLTLALRSLAADEGGKPLSEDGAIAPPDGENGSWTWDAEVSRLLPPVDPLSARTRVNVNRGSERTVVEFPKEPGK